MSAVIVLTAEQAEEVSGVSDVAPLAALVPDPLTDGRFILGVSVLSDPAHERHWALLSTCPQVNIETLDGLIPVVIHA